MMSDTIIQKRINSKFITKSTEWDTFRETVYNITNFDWFKKKYLKATVDLFTNILISTGKEATSLNTRISKERYPHEIIELVLKKRRARHCWQKIHSPEDKKKHSTHSIEWITHKLLNIWLKINYNEHTFSFFQLFQDDVNNTRKASKYKNKKKLKKTWHLLSNNVVSLLFS